MSDFLKRIQEMPANRLALLASELQIQLDRERERSGEAIAIVGLAGRYPGGCDTPEAFWDLLAQGRDALEDTPTARWDMDALHDADPAATGKIVTRRGSFIRDFDCFDADFFGIPAAEAQTMDPQHRLLLEVGWEALENTGLAPQRWKGTKAGVFVAICTSDYVDLLTRSDTVWDGRLAQGTAHSLAAGRLSYTFGFEGPCLAVDTACSSSLIAAHLACHSLRTGECDMALVGGVNVLISPLVSIDFSRARILSPSGICRPFDARADGYVRGEGCGMMVLKRLSDARRDGDVVRAVIRGSAMNHVGRGGLMTPKASSQEAVIRQALAAARVDGAEVDYLEASSVGTAVGDPIEVEALRQTLCRGRRPTAPLLMGSVKTNIGHLEASSGMAALTKVVLSLEHGVIPPHLHLERPNPEVPWADLPLRVPLQNTPWPNAHDAPRRAAISSFAISGSNAHMILEQAPERPAAAARAPGPRVLPVSAKTDAALARLCERFIARLEASPDALDFDAICATAATGRLHHARRIAVVGETAAQMARALRSRVAEGAGAAAAARPGKLALLFPACAGVASALLRELTDLDGEAALPAASPETTWFRLQLRLAKAWRQWGAQAAFTLGEQGGECAAACVAGLFDAETGAALVAARADDAALARVLAGLDFQPERLRIVSGSSGRIAARGELADRDYWRRQARAAGDLGRGLAELVDAGVGLCVVLGFEPDPASVPAGLEVIAALGEGRSLAAMQAAGLAALYESGVEVDWEAVQVGRPAARTTIPGYPFERRRFWPHLTTPGRSLVGERPAPPETPVDTAAGDPEPIGQVIRRELAQLLGCEPESIADDAQLTELGLDSLRALQFKDRLGYLLRVELPVARLAGSPTVAELTRFIEHQTAQSDAMADWPTLTPDPAGRHEAFALTEIQQAYWIGRHAGLELGGISTHAYFEYQLAGLDIARLEQALRRVIERHDMLRAIVQPNGRQVVLRDLPAYRVRVDDYGALEADALEQTLAQIRRETSHEVRPADRWPLFEVRASLLPGGLTRLHVSIDLLIVDAWSIEILAGEIALLYAWPDAELAPLALSFRDFILAQGALENTGIYRRSEHYWKARLAELPAAPQLPVTLPSSGAPPQEFRRRMWRLDAAGWGRVQADARRAGVSPTVAVLTAFAHVLRDWSRSPRFTVNLTLFNRPPLHPQINDVIGDFTSLTLLEADLSGEAAFEARALQLQRQLWSDLDHRYFGGVRVLRELARRTGRPAEALMPVVFTAALGLGTGLSSALEGELVYAVSQTPQVWLDHQVLEDDGELVIIWDAVEALFPAGLLDDMFEAYTGLLGRLASAQGEAWSEPVAALTPARQLEVRRALNMPPAPLSDALLHTLFTRQAEAHAERPAVIAPELTLSHAQLARRAAALACRLIEQGAAPNRLVAIVMDKGWQQVVAALAILESGAAYVPIDARTPRERLWALLEDCGAEIVVTQPALRETIEWPPQLKALLSEFDDPGIALAPLPPRQQPQDLAYVIFTSGSSGKPKGVMIDHRGAVNTVLDINRRFGLNADDRTLALSSLSFDLSVWDIFGLLAAGGAVVMPQTDALRDPAHWVELLAAHRVTVWNSVPALMQLAANFADQGGRVWPASLRLVMLSGDWIPVALPAQIQALAPPGLALPVVSLGGATEASIWSIFHPVEPGDQTLPSIPYGRPLAQQGLHVLDDDWRPRPDGVPGQLFIEGLGLAQGYWHDPEKTAAAFVAHPRTGKRLYRTGDLARYRADGTLEFLGREDAQVKVQGFRIELGEIEAQLARHAQVRQCVVVAAGERTSRRLVACVVPVAGQALDSNALREHLAGCLPEYMIPGVFVELPALPMTPNGKVDSREIQRIAADSGLGRGGAGPADDDADPLTLRLLELVKAELKVQELGVHTNLLQIGANSLDMLGLVNEVERQLGFRPKVEEFFRNPSIAGLRDLRRRHEANEDVADTRPLGDLENIDLEELAGTGQTTLVLDPRQRESLKRQSLESRRFGDGHARAALLPGPPTLTELEAFAARRSHREFDPRPLPLQRLAATLACLRRLTLDGKPKHLYGSAGGLYPVQTYLSVKPGRIEGLGAGSYYFDPVAADLVLLQPGAEVPADVHVAYNQAYFNASAFSVYLVAETTAIGALYGELSAHLCAIEAGLMAQLLELWGAGHQLGFCQIGTIAFEGLRRSFQLRASHTLLHTLVGGAFAEPERPAEAPAGADDIEEGTI